jgi:hypothetical protein
LLIIVEFTGGSPIAGTRDRPPIAGETGPRRVPSGPHENLLARRDQKAPRRFAGCFVLDSFGYR